MSAAVSLALTALAAAVPGGAAVPAGLTQQGRILDSNGNPLNADVTVVFSIYDDAEAAEPENVLWSESQEITLEDGYFSTRLGEDADNQFPAGLFDGAGRYVGVQIGADEEMRPRERVGSVPYAFVANDAVGDIHPASAAVAGAVSAASLSVSGDATIDGTIRGASWGFGGLYSTADCATTNIAVNPITDAYSCPPGFTAHPLARFRTAEPECGANLWMCIR